MRQFGVYSPETAKIIYDQVVNNNANILPVPPGESPQDPFRPRYARLAENLDAATGNLTGYTTAKANLLRYTYDSQNPIRQNLDMEEVTKDDLQITVTNRSTSLSAGSGVMVIVIRIGSEWAVIGLAGGSSGGGDCPCDCLDAGDLTYDGFETTSQWQVILQTVRETQTNGTAILDGGTHTLTWDAANSYWTKDIGDELTAEYTSGNDATGASTLDGDITLRKDESGYSTLKLTITATIPAEV